VLSVPCTGTLNTEPQQRTSAKGATYATALMCVPSDGAEAVLMSLICFNAGTVEALLAHAKGDTIACAGKAKLSQWTGRDGNEAHGLSMIAERVLSA